MLRKIILVKKTEFSDAKIQIYERMLSLLRTWIHNNIQVIIYTYSVITFEVGFFYYALSTQDLKSLLFGILNIL